MELLHTAHVPAGDGPHPTIIALHGWGASAHDLFGLAPLLYGGEALVLAPEGPIAFPVGPGLDGHGWFPLSGGGPPDPAAFAQGAADVESFLEYAFERYPIDRGRVLLLGFSQGGVMAYDAFLRRPERFAGLAALSSWLAPALVEAHPPTEAEAGKPVLVMHGTRDSMIGIDRAHVARELLAERKLELTYREFEMGHEINGEALQVLASWIESEVF